MEFTKIAGTISLVSCLLAITHIIWPTLGIDATTIALLILAAFPWLIPVLKSVELPGGVKIELKDAKAATDKVISELPFQPTVLETEETPGVRIRTYDASSTVDALRNVAKRDPNLALVGFRIEIEKRIFGIAEKAGIKTEHSNLSRLVRELQRQKVLPAQVASGLTELTNLGNRAAHGAEVTPDAAEWVLDAGPSILLNLDKLTSE